jgi:hypothetical protein
MKSFFVIIGVPLLLALVSVLILVCYGIGGIVFSWFWNWLAPVVVATAPHLSANGGFALGVLVGAFQWLLAKRGK